MFAAHVRITLGVLRNGPAADVSRTARESSLNPRYYFSGVRYAADLDGVPTAGARVPSCPTAVLLEAQVRCAFSTIVEAEVLAAQNAHDAAAGAFDPDPVRAAAIASAANRLEAIAIGSVDTALVLSYRIVDGDLRNTESNEAKLDVIPPAAVADDAALRALTETVTSGWSIQLASGNDATAATAEELVMINMAPLTTVEVDLAYAFMVMGQAAPVRAGAQLLETGHHYLSDADASARCRAIEREVTNTLASDARNLWRANIELFRNAIWHAAPHRVTTAVLEGFAEDPDMPDRLNATGFGSMAVGLPALEDLFARAKAYLAVYDHIAQTAAAHGHTITLNDLKATVTALTNLNRRGQLTGNKPVLPGSPETAWPPNCDTRAKALKLYLEPATAKAEPVAAWMFGFYKEICSRAGIRATSPEGSLLRAYSLKRAVSNFVGEANRAQEMYAARARYIRTKAEEGELETYSGSA